MDILLLTVTHFLDAAADLEVARLVVSAVGARDQLLVGALEGEPGLQIVLLGSSVIQGSRDDRDNTVGETQGLVKLFRVLDHVVKHLPGLLGLSQAELLNLLELVDTENTPGVTASSTGLLAEAGRVAGVLDGQLLLGLLEPLVGVEGRDGLLRGGDQVHVLVVASDLVELLVELGKLGSLGHGLLLHEVRGLELLVLALAQEGKAIVDKSHVELNTGIGQEVAAVGGDLVTTLGIVGTETVEDLVVGVDLGVVLGLLATDEVGALDNVVVLSFVSKHSSGARKKIVSHVFTHEDVDSLRLQLHVQSVDESKLQYLVIRDGNRVVNQVADQAQLAVPEKLLGLDIELHSLGLLLGVSTSLDEFSGVFLFLFSPIETQ